MRRQGENVKSQNMKMWTTDKDWTQYEFFLFHLSLTELYQKFLSPLICLQIVLQVKWGPLLKCQSTGTGGKAPVSRASVQGVQGGNGSLRTQAVSVTQMLAPRPFTYLLPGGVERLSGAWGSDCIDHVGPLGLITGRRVGGVEALLLFMTPLAKFRFVT